MDRMHAEMNAMQVTGDVDRDFVALMVPHHQSAVDMARIYLESGTDPELRRLAQQIVTSQETEIAHMRAQVPDTPATSAEAHSGH
jgi:uncharacterized protein (DUF305 family)